MLKLHSHGADVRTLQQLLNEAGASPKLAVDGDFGPRTERAVREFQAHHHDESGRPLAVDGEVGPKTWWALRHEKASKNHGTSPGGSSGTQGAGGGGHPPPAGGGSVGQRIVRIATHEAERGVREHGYNTGADVRMYQHATGLAGTGWPWCAAFVTWVYEKAGLVLDTSAGFASVWLMEQWARNTGRWHARAGSHRAPPGAIVIFRFSHTGIVVAGHGGYDSTVEGNTSSGNSGSQSNGDGVYKRARSHSLVKGYVVMKQILH